MHVQVGGYSTVIVIKPWTFFLPFIVYMQYTRLKVTRCTENEHKTATCVICVAHVATKISHMLSNQMEAISYRCRAIQCTMYMHHGKRRQCVGICQRCFPGWTPASRQFGDTAIQRPRLVSHKRVVTSVDIFWRLSSCSLIGLFNFEAMFADFCQSVCWSNSQLALIPPTLEGAASIMKPREEKDKVYHSEFHPRAASGGQDTHHFRFCSTSPSLESKMPITCGDIPRLICSVIIPPVGVFFQVGCTKDLAINCLLTVLGYIPGVIHAVYILIKE